MAEVTVKHNLPDFRRQLEGVADRMQASYVADATRAVVRIMARAAKSNAAPHNRTGTLQRAIYYGVRKRTSRGLVTAFVAARSGVKERSRANTPTKTGRMRASRDAYYWRWVEGGHRIVKRGGSLRKGGRATRSLARYRFSGGSVPGIEFLAKAFRSTQGAALAAFNRVMDDRLKHEK